MEAQTLNQTSIVGVPVSAVETGNLHRHTLTFVAEGRNVVWGTDSKGRLHRFSKDRVAVWWADGRCLYILADRAEFTRRGILSA